MSSRRNNLSSLLPRWLLLAAVLFVAATEELRSQITFDGTWAAGSPAGPNYVFDGTNGHQAGSNMFHSFLDFNVASGETATFNGVGVTNFLSRVTGANSSMIDGTIRSTVPGANIFLLNPNGVIFGANAQLDLTGSFTATTADFIELSDGQQFFATPGAADAVLTSAPPAAFGFLGPPGGSISAMNSTLEVTPTNAIRLVAYDIDLDTASLRAPGGSVSLISSSSGGRVEIAPGDSGSAADGTALSSGGRVALTDTFITTSDFTGGTEGGRVVIRGGALRMTKSRRGIGEQWSQHGTGNRYPGRRTHSSD